MAWRSAPWLGAVTPGVVGSLVGIFLLCNMFLLNSVYERSVVETKSNRREATQIQGTQFMDTLLRHFVQVEDQWRVMGPQRHPSDIVSDDERLIRVAVQQPTLLDWDLDCRDLRGVSGEQYVAAGWTKTSYRAVYANRTVAVKTVNLHGHDVAECLRADYQRTLQECYRRAAFKVLKEILMLKALAHQNIVKILGYCIPTREFSADRTSIVAVITELGEPLDAIKLLQMSWENRLRVSLGMSLLLYHLAHSSLGTVLMNDFRRQQFVLVNGELKLSDVDDVVIGEPTCLSDRNCQILLKGKNSNITVPCINKKCQNFNEKQNTISAGRHFTSFLLPHGAPPKLRPLVDAIIEAYGWAHWNTSQLMQKTQELVNHFVYGKYRDTPESTNFLQEYKAAEDSDLPGLYDYRCKLTLSGHGCTLSVFNAEEAAQICSSDTDCKAFVLTSDRTWTGRRLAHFKDNYTTATYKKGTVLYIHNG